MTAILFIFSALFGACVGSFLNVCIYRLPREGLTVSKPSRSFCPSCGSPIRWHDNIPVVSWLFLGGRCRDCRAPISSRYFLVETLTACLFTLACSRFLDAGSPSWAAYLVVVVLISALVVASFIDLELRIIPDEITIRGMMAAPFVALLVPELHDHQRGSALFRALERSEEWLEGATGFIPDGLRSGFPFAGIVVTAACIACVGGAFLFARHRNRSQAREPGPRGEPARAWKEGRLAGILAAAVVGMLAANVLKPDLLLDRRVQSFWTAIAGMGAGSLLVYWVGWIGSKVFRKPAMGFGDVKLMGLLGAFTGWIGIIEAFFLACFLGSIVGVFILLRYRSRYIPFGPFLATGAMVLILRPEAIEGILRWYMALLRG